MTNLKFKEVRGAVAKLQSGGHRWFIQLVFEDKEGKEHTWDLEKPEDMNQVVKDVRITFQAQKDVRGDYESMWT